MTSTTLKNIDGALGTGTPFQELKKYGKANMRCTACGEERHDMEHCYSATADGNLSLPSLAFLDKKDSDRKLEMAQRDGCSLHKQPPKVIDIIRDIVDNIRRTLTPMEREKNIQNRREARVMRKAGTIPKSNQKSKLLAIEGSDGNARVTTDQASLKSLHQTEHAEKFMEFNQDMMNQMTEMREEMNRMKINNNSIKALAIEEDDDNSDQVDSTTHTGMGVLIHTMFNAIKSVNGVSTEGIDKLLLKNERVSNRSLTYLNFLIRGIRSGDEPLLEVEKHRVKWLHDTSQSTDLKNDEGINIQKDNG